MLKIRAWQDQTLDAAGWCRLEITGAVLTPDAPVEICYRRGGDSRPFLGAGDWQENEYWHPLEISGRDAGSLTAMVGPQATVPLSAVTTLEIRLREAGGELQNANRTRIAWPKIILPGGNAAGDAAASPPPSPPPPPPPAPEPEPVIETPKPEPKPKPDKKPGGKGKWVAIAAVLLIAIGAGAWYAGLIPGLEPAPPAPAYDQASMQAFIATNPDGPSASAKADEFLAAGKPDLALLIYRYADRKSDPAAAVAIGKMYDPAVHSPETSPFPSPNADQAIEYYRKAADAGYPAAQYALGKLMVSGATSGPTDAEQGVVWLQRAAKLGNADAINELQKLGISN